MDADDFRLAVIVVFGLLGWFAISTWREVEMPQPKSAPSSHINAKEPK